MVGTELLRSYVLGLLFPSLKCLLPLQRDSRFWSSRSTAALAGAWYIWALYQALLVELHITFVFGNLKITVRFSSRSPSTVIRASFMRLAPCKPPLRGAYR